MLLAAVKTLLSLVLHVMCVLCWQAKHAVEGNTTWGVNGETGEITDMNELGVWDTYSVKAQTLKTAIEVASNLVMFYFHLLRGLASAYCLLVCKGIISNHISLFHKTHLQSYFLCLFRPPCFCCVLMTLCQERRKPAAKKVHNPEQLLLQAQQLRSNQHCKARSI